MPTTEFIWTAVPGGTDPADDGGDALLLNVHVGIGLRQDPGDNGRLDDHTALLHPDTGQPHWPPVGLDPLGGGPSPADMTFDVLIDDGGPETVYADVPVDVTTYNRDFWSAVFKVDTKVQDLQRRDLRARGIKTYPAAKLAQVIQNVYTAAFPNGLGGYPTPAGLLASGLSDVSFRGRGGVDRRKAAEAKFSQAFTANGVIDTRASAPPGVPPATFDTYQALDFFRPQDVSVFDTPTADPTFSFHEAITGLNAEPTLQRLFGLVLTLRLSRRDVNVTFGSSPIIGIRVKPQSDQLGTAEHRHPRTVTDYGNGGSSLAFNPRPRPTDPIVADGYLRMNQSDGIYSVSLVDPTDAVKLSTAAGNVEVNNELPDSTKPETESLPALRSGLFVSQNGLAKDLHDKFADTPPTTADIDGKDLFAEDLMKGFLVDIRRSSPDSGAVDPWRSEAFHSTRVTFDTNPALDLEISAEEGHSSRGLTERLDGDPNLYAGEIVYPWEGFPAGLPMPGRALNSDPGAPNQAVDPDTNPTGAPAGDLPFTITHGRPDPAQHKFARLLCGDDYEFRARVRWIDGTNLPADDGNETHATDRVRYLRTEPVPPHDLYPTEEYVPGEGQATLVLRGNYDTPPEKPFAQRFMVPKRVAFTDVLKTRLLDAGGVIDPSIYADLARRDAFEFTVGTPGVTPMTGQPDQVMVDPATYPLAPILPDPLVGGAAVHLRGPNPATVGLADSSAYPKADTFTIHLEEGPAVNLLAQGSTFTFQLRKGDKVRGAISARLDADAERWLALLNWVGVGNYDANSVVAGRHTAITPWNDLTLIYAVRQPLLLGVIDDKYRLQRPKRSTWVGFSDGRIFFSRRSTNQIDVTAAWKEYTDDGPGGPEPTWAGNPATDVSKDAAITVQVDHADDSVDVYEFNEDGSPDRIEFGDTRHRHLTLGTTVTSRYAEHFTETVPATYQGGATVDLPGDALVPGWVRITTPRPFVDRATDPERGLNDLANASDRVETLKRALPKNPMGTAEQDPFDAANYYPGHFRVNEANGVVELLPKTAFGTPGDAPAGNGLYELFDGDELRITYLLPPVTRGWPEEGQPGLEINVAASTAPAAPVVRYVVPTFGWASSGDPTAQVTSQRDGRGLRIYLERPWWTSGEGELLGVLLWGQAEPNVDDGQPTDDVDAEHHLFPYVTQWGEDPLFDAGGLPSRYPPSTQFTNRVATSDRVLRVDGSLPQQFDPPTPDNGVVAVGHEVTFDPERDLWFTDIVLDSGHAYTPFIRLALARYQPHALGGCELSPVVLAEFVQLAPDRSATVVVGTADPRNLTVTLSGLGPSEFDEPTVPRGRVQVTVEARRPNAGLYADDELTWMPVATPVQLTGSRGGQVNQWTGTIQLPASPSPREYRIVVEEFETHLIEPTQEGFLPGLGGRLVHTDTIVVTAGGPDLGGPPPGGGGGAPGPAPEFQEPGELIDPPEFDEFVLVEITEPDIAGPVINEIELSIGTVVIELLGVRGQGQLLVGIPDRGSFPDRGGVTIGNVIDVSTSGITHEGANVTMPRGFSPSAGNSLGTRMLHFGGGGLGDVTTGVDGEAVSGFSATLSPFAAAEYSGLQRFAGSGRIETAAAISAGTFGPATSLVYLATAGAFPDALTAGPRAAAQGAPILLVGEELPEATAAEIERLDPNEIVLLGGPVAIPDDVAFTLRERFPSATIRRLAGESRFATAAAVSGEAFPNGAPVAYVATAGSFPDALCGGPAAQRDGGPMLLVTPDSVPAETAHELVRLAPDRVVVLGGTAAVSGAVAAELEELTGADVIRLAGPDRYATGAAIVGTFTSPRTVFVATGESFPDALAGVPATGGDSAAMVLVRTDAIPEASAAQISRLAPDRIVVLGGDAAVSESLEEQLAGYLLEE